MRSGGPRNEASTRRRRHEGVPKVRHQRVIDEEHVSILPLERDTPLSHEVHHRRRTATEDQHLVTPVVSIVPCSESRDDRIEQDLLARDGILPNSW